jgi:hypothetical protein
MVTEVSFGMGEIAVQGQHQEPFGPRQRRQRFTGPADLAGARQEDQDVPHQALPAEPARRGRDSLGQGPVVRRLRVLDVHGKDAAVAAHRRTAQEVCNRLAVQGCGHHGQAQVGTLAVLEPGEQGQRQVGGQVAFVKLVEQDGRNPGQIRLGQEPPQEDALGHESDAGSRARDILEANRVADGLADLLAHLLRDPRGSQARGQAPGLEHDDLTLPCAREECRRHPRGLARAGRRFDDQARRSGQAGHDVRQQGIDRQASG